MKAFPKTDPKILTVTIDENGDMLYLKTPLSDVLLELGTVVEKRASHVEPVNIFQRIAFRALRLFGDKTRVAEWTRTWQCEWLVDTRPVGGPVLSWNDVYSHEQKRQMVRDQAIDEIVGNPVVSNLKNVATWRNRQDAIDAEVAFLNNFFLTR